MPQESSIFQFSHYHAHEEKCDKTCFDLNVITVASKIRLLRVFVCKLLQVLSGLFETATTVVNDELTTLFPNVFFANNCISNTGEKYLHRYYSTLTRLIINDK